ncbi:serine hydrolase [Endozoicomonas euniceicola]|uniref:Serine hydrolase n=1 Tax=Endozoicomonas euniceicola TaxID=1234143 RepID=A0ABY6GRG5_9GAMM|nr:serine hydrolase [Endozoicomonas euniceicola]UYM14741.1 serine hydrolase [Endozoicomonas euniceicola]
MKKQLLAIAISLAGISAAHATTTYHQPDQKMLDNLESYQVSAANWEEAKNMRFTMSDAHLYHNYALVTPDAKNKMPLKVVGGFDPAKMMVDDIRPGKKISMYNVMRDRAAIQSYVIMNKDGEILSEDYWSNTEETTNHHVMSAHKSFSSMLAFAVADAGYFKMSDPIGKYAPEFKGSKFENVSIQNFADMTAGVWDLPKSRDDYHNWGMTGLTTGSWDSHMAVSVGYNGLVKDKDGKQVPPVDAYGQLNNFSEWLKVFAKEVKPSAGPGEFYAYRDVNTEMLGLVVTRTTGLPYAEALDKFIWSKGGFNYPVSFFVNQEKESAASGSMNVTARDFAIGSYLMVHDGKNWKGEQVFPKSYVDAVKNGDEVVKNAWAQREYEALVYPQAFYKNQWRTVTDPETGKTFSTMIGVNGNFSAFDHETGNIIAVQGAYREPTGYAYVEVYVRSVIQPIFDELAKKNKG